MTKNKCLLNGSCRLVNPTCPSRDYALVQWGLHQSPPVWMHFKKMLQRIFTNRIYCLFIAIVFLTGCELYAKPKIPLLSAPDKFRTTLKNTAIKNFPEQWWKVFNDSQLNQIVDLALNNNTSYQIALKNIQIAKTYVTQNASAFFPTVNVGYNYSRNKLSKNAAVAEAFSSVGSNTASPFNYNRLEATVSYELDVWHKIGNSVKQARANVAMTAADSDVIKLTLLSNVVSTYLQIEALNFNLENLQQQYQAINAMVKMIGDQYQGGLINIEPLSDMKTQAENIKSSLAEIKKQQQIAYHTLAYLVGEYPEKFSFNIKHRLSVLKFNKMIPVGIPAKVLAVRPDIQSAYYQVLAYGYLEKQNLANFLPAISLTGMYGFASTQLTNFISGGGAAWNYGAGALETLFNGGNLWSQYKRAKLQYQAAILNYKDVVLSAFKEVNDVLIAYKQDYIILGAIQREMLNFKDKYDSANAQYIAGTYDYATYLQYRLSYLQSQYNLTQQRLVVAQDVINVYKALGVGL